MGQSSGAGGSTRGLYCELVVRDRPAGKGPEVVLAARYSAEQQRLEVILSSSGARHWLGVSAKTWELLRADGCRVHSIYSILNDTGSPGRSDDAWQEPPE